MDYSILAVIEDIKEFVVFCRNDKELAGYDVIPHETAGYSYLIAKRTTSHSVAYFRKIALDCIDPIQRGIIFEAMHKAIYGKVIYEEVERQMICKSEPH